jgi:hypothetical protein
MRRTSCSWKHSLATAFKGFGPIVSATKREKFCLPSNFLFFRRYDMIIVSAVVDDQCRRRLLGRNNPSHASSADGTGTGSTVLVE